MGTSWVGEMGDEWTRAEAGSDPKDLMSAPPSGGRTRDETAPGLPPGRFVYTRMQ